MTNVQTSSIGPQWPPENASHGRIKGIDRRGRIDDLDRLEDLLETVAALADSLEPKTRDRVSIRALVSRRLVREQGERLGPWGEAIIPLEGCGEELRDLCLLYLGANDRVRAEDPKDLKKSLENVEIAESRDLRGASSMIARVLDGGYDLRILGKGERTGDPDLHRAMSELYARFGWSAEETREILNNPHGLIAVAEWEGEPVSAGIAELSHVAFDDGLDLRMAELTEAVTRVAHRGRGLYSGIVSLLSRELTRRSKAGEIAGGELNVAFGECSGHDLGVLIAAKQLGRTFSLRVCRDEGLPFPGYLPQHVPIDGAPRSTPYNDLFPTFLSRKTLYAFAET